MPGSHPIQPHTIYSSSVLAVIVRNTTPQPHHHTPTCPTSPCPTPANLASPTQPHPPHPPHSITPPICLRRGGVLWGGVGWGVPLVAEFRNTPPPHIYIYIYIYIYLYIYMYGSCPPDSMHVYVWVGTPPRPTPPHRLRSLVVSPIQPQPSSPSHPTPPTSFHST